MGFFRARVSLRICVHCIVCCLSFQRASFYAPTTTELRSDFHAHDTSWANHLDSPATHVTPTVRFSVLNFRTGRTPATNCHGSRYSRRRQSRPDEAPRGWPHSSNAFHEAENRTADPNAFPHTVMPEHAAKYWANTGSTRQIPSLYDSNVA